MMNDEVQHGNMIPDHGTGTGYASIIQMFYFSQIRCKYDAKS